MSQMSLDLFSSTTIRKAERLLEKPLEVYRDLDYPDVWWVVASSGTHWYRVHIDPSMQWGTCTCPHGLRKGGGKPRCYHMAAALMAREAQASSQDLPQ